MGNVIDFEEYRKKRALHEFIVAVSMYPTESDVYLLYWNILPEDFVELSEWVEHNL